MTSFVGGDANGREEAAECVDRLWSRQTRSGLGSAGIGSLARAAGTLAATYGPAFFYPKPAPGNAGYWHFVSHDVGSPKLARGYESWMAGIAGGHLNTPAAGRWNGTVHVFPFQGGVVDPTGFAGGSVETNSAWFGLTSRWLALWTYEAALVSGKSFAEGIRLLRDRDG